MAESSDKLPPSKPRFHFLLRCFGSSPKVQSQKAQPIAPRNCRTPSLRFRFKKSSATVVDAAVPNVTVPCHDGASLMPEFKKSPPPPPIKSRPSAVEGEIIVDYETIKPSETRKKSESTQSNPTAEKLPPAKKTAASLHSGSLPSRLLNRQKDSKKSISHLATAAAPTTTPASSNSWKPVPKPRTKSPAKKFDSVIVIVAVAIVVLWGRLCAILCTAALFYLRRRLRSEV